MFIYSCLRDSIYHFLGSYCTNMMRVACVIPAGGLGLRMEMPTPKQLLQLHGKTILAHTLTNMQKVRRVEMIVVVTSGLLQEPIQNEINSVLRESSVCPIVVVITHGEVDSRHASIKAGVDFLEGRGFGLVIIHDAVRPLVPLELVDELLLAAEQSGAAGPWVSLVSTVLQKDANGFMQAAVPRYPDERGFSFVASEMPQVFRFEIIKQAYSLCDDHELINGTECLELVRRYCGIQPKLVEGDQNVLWKITLQKDLLLAQKALLSNAAQS